MDSELKKPFEMVFKILKMCGMWQDGKQTWSYFVAGYVVHFISLELCIACQLMYVLLAEEIEIIIDVLGGCVAFIALLFKCFNFLHKIEKIIKMAKSLNLLLESTGKSMHSDRPLIKKEVAFAYKIFKVLITWVILT
jgi:hypothetical protein